MSDTTITLTEEQQVAADNAIAFLESFPNTRREFFVIEGYAGTGKSFSVKTILEQTGLKAKYMAYTGKAALVLRRYGGLPAQTIHSTIYKYQPPSETAIRKLYEERDACKDDARLKEIDKILADLNQPIFSLNDEAFEDDDTEVLVLDECSMVDEDILADLTSFGIPIIALGDPGQLPPVKGEGALFKGVSDARLTTILRQALDSPIIQWATWARQKRTLPMTNQDTWETDEVSKLHNSMLSMSDLMEMMTSHDMTICWRNATRQKINQMRRKFLGFHDVYPQEGDTLIITKNDKEAGIFNGLFVTVLERQKEFDMYIEYKVQPEDMGDESNPPKVLKLLKAPFEEYVNPQAMKNLKPWDRKGTHEADFGYVITCHKSQGSQWPSVLVLDEDVLTWPKVAEERAQWLYTAVTRAAKKLTVVGGKW